MFLKAQRAWRMLAGSHCWKTFFSIHFSLILSGLLRHNCCSQGQGHSGDQQAIRKRLRKHENDLWFIWGMDVIPPNPFWDYWLLAGNLEPHVAFLQPTVIKNPVPWPASIPTFPWYDGSSKGAPHTRGFKAEQLHMRVDTLRSLLVCSWCWAGYLSYFHVHSLFLTCIRRLRKKPSWKVSQKPSWTTGHMRLMADLGNFGALRKVCVKQAFSEEGNACWLQGVAGKTARLLPLSQQQTSSSLSMILSALVWTEGEGRPWKTKPRELILIHFSYIRSRYKAFQNISGMLVSCGWFTGCDRKSISVPVDAKFITLPQNSDSPLLLELQLVAMATSARQYFFFSSHYFPLAQLHIAVKIVSFCNIKKNPTTYKNHCVLLQGIPLYEFRPDIIYAA